MSLSSHRAPAKFLLVSAVILMIPLSVLPQNASYVGARKCRPCHLKQFTGTSATRMAAAFELLKPGVRPDAEVKSKLDPNKDYTHDSTGYGKRGGFRSIETTPETAGVQCEAYHEAFSEALNVMTLQNKSYKRGEVVAAGLAIPKAKACKGKCHNSNSPFVGANYVFDYPSRKTKGTHEHLPLRFPHD